MKKGSPFVAAGSLMAGCNTMSPAQKTTSELTTSAQAHIANAGRVEKPNILLIMADEQCATAMSCAGNPYLKTPNMDRMAKNGVRFEMAYTTQPLCVPFRSALQTGRWPHQTGVMVNNTRFLASGVPAGPMIGGLIRKEGYECGFLGKMHICHRRPNGGRPIDLHPDDVNHHGYAPAKEGKDEDIAPGFKIFLDKHPDAPFFFTASFDEPHTCLGLGSDPNRLAHKIGRAPDDLDKLPPLPANHVPAPDEPNILADYWLNMEGKWLKDGGREPATSDSWSELQWRQYLWAYYRIVEKLDKDMGDLLDVLEASDRADNTLIIFTVDHGDGAAHRRRRKKQTLYDESARIPFIISGARVLNKNTVDTTRLISNIDVPPTILDYTGVARPDHVEGQSLRPLIETGTWKDHPYVVTETLFNKGILAPGWSGRMVRTLNYKYIAYNYGDRREQFFDMNADPGEMTNLADNPEFKTVLEEHRAHLSEWCRETKDSFDAAIQEKRVPVLQ